MTKRPVLARVDQLRRIGFALRDGRPLAPEDMLWLAEAIDKFVATRQSLHELLGILGTWRTARQKEDRDEYIGSRAAKLKGSVPEIAKIIAGDPRYGCHNLKAPTIEKIVRAKRSGG